MLSVESTAHWPRPINLLAKRAGERSAGNLHAPFDVAGDGNQLTVRLVRHSQRKRGATDRSNLRSQAPFLDPTKGEILNSKPHAPLPPFESLDNFGRSYFSRAVYDEVRTQKNSHLGLAGRSLSNQWARQCKGSNFLAG